MKEEDERKIIVKTIHILSFVIISIIITISYNFGYYEGRMSVQQEVNYKKEIK